MCITLESIVLSETLGTGLRDAAQAQARRTAQVVQDHEVAKAQAVQSRQRVVQPTGERGIGAREAQAELQAAFGLGRGGGLGHHVARW